MLQLQSVLLIINVFAFSSTAQNYDSAPIAKTSFGLLQGISHFIAERTLKIDAFYSVPYADPPIGLNRFEKPIPPSEWRGIRMAQTQPRACVPHARPTSKNSPNYIYSEDCLYLNIFTANRPKTNEVSGADLVPVLVLIHGGAYEMGSAQRYSNYAVIGSKFVSRKIVCVAVQYRLGFTGFASSGETSFAGNYGLWDLAEALHFVRENIRAFGGDPERIFLYGFSAGAAAVSSLSFSPYTRDQFKGAIQLSGSVMAARMTNERVVNETRMLAAELNCSDTADEEDAFAMKKCLKTKSIDDIFNAVDAIGTTRMEVNFVKFGPRIDGQFFPKDHPFLIGESQPKPTIIGFATEEALLNALILGNSSLTSYSIAPAERETFDRSRLERFVREVIAPSKKFLVGGLTIAQRVQDRIIDFYCDRMETSKTNKDNLFYLRRYLGVLSDVLYVVPIVWESRLKAQMNWPLYLYWNEHVNEEMFADNVKIRESFHGYEDNLLFPGAVPERVARDDRDEKVESIFLNAIISFTKYGKPSVESVDWPRTIPTSPMRYLKINRKGRAHKLVEIKDLIAFERFKFWLEIIEQFPEYNIVRDSHHPEFAKHDEL